MYVCGLPVIGKGEKAGCPGILAGKPAAARSVAEHKVDEPVLPQVEHKVDEPVLPRSLGRHEGSSDNGKSIGCPMVGGEYLNGPS